MDKRPIEIFDTSLRDWAQTPWVNLTAEDKIEIAKVLDELWVDVIEAGFAAASPADFEAIQQIIKQTQNAIICSLARLVENDIDEAFRALKENMEKALIHTFIWTSPLHRKYKLKMSEKEILTRIKQMLNYTNSKFHSRQIMFSPEDALRTEEEFLFEVVETAINHWAKIINIPDTVWFAQPDEIKNLMENLTSEFGKEAKFSIHCHNDLWNAVINSLYALLWWARIVQGTIPPLFGERAGNADLVELLMNVFTRPDYYPFIIEKINFEKIRSTVKLIEDISWKKIPPHYPILWRFVHSHSSWIHQHWVDKHKGTYEIISPEKIWMKIEQSFILTNQSWRAGLQNAIETYFGIKLPKKKLDEIFIEFKKLTSRLKFITMNDIRELLLQHWIKIKRKFNIKRWEINIELWQNKVIAKIVFEDQNGNQKFVKSEGVGPVDAVFKAFLKYIEENFFTLDFKLLDFQITNLWNSSEAAAEVYIMAEINGIIKEEYWRDKDIVKASIQALLNLLNRCI